MVDINAISNTSTVNNCFIIWFVFYFGNCGNNIQHQTLLIRLARVDVGVITDGVTNTKSWYWLACTRMTSLFSCNLVNITKYGLGWTHFGANEKPFIYRSYNNNVYHSMEFSCVTSLKFERFRFSQHYSVKTHSILKLYLSIKRKRNLPQFSIY